MDGLVTIRQVIGVACLTSMEGMASNLMHWLFHDETTLRADCIMQVGIGDDVSMPMDVGLINDACLMEDSLVKGNSFDDLVDCPIFERSHRFLRIAWMRRSQLLIICSLLLLFLLVSGLSFLGSLRLLLLALLLLGMLFGLLRLFLLLLISRLFQISLILDLIVLRMVKEIAVMMREFSILFICRLFEASAIVFKLVTVSVRKNRVAFALKVFDWLRRLGS